LSSAEIYDPATGTWTATVSLTTARAYHTATLLPNGTVLVAAGSGLNGFLSSAEIY
jgi:tetrahydromethanopterin S-methyltransferase subunit D